MSRDDATFEIHDVPDEVIDEELRIPADAPEDVRWVALCAGHVASIQNHPLAPDAGDYNNISPVTMARSMQQLAKAKPTDPLVDEDALEQALHRVRGKGNYSGWGGYCGGPLNAMRVAAVFARSYKRFREEGDDGD